MFYVARFWAHYKIAYFLLLFAVIDIFWLIYLLTISLGTS